MPDKPNKDRWSSLDWPTRAELIKIYVKHGITSASDMRQHYNSLEDPIFKDRPKPKADLYNRLVDEKDNRSIKIGDGVGTHLMSWATVDDKPVGYSQIQPDNNGNLKDYGDRALDSAIERGDTIQFRDEKDADWWTSNNYKQFYKKMTPAYDEYRREKLKEKYPFYNTEVMNVKANGGHLYQGHSEPTQKMRTLYDEASDQIYGILPELTVSAKAPKGYTGYPKAFEEEYSDNGGIYGGFRNKDKAYKEWQTTQKYFSPENLDKYRWKGFKPFAPLVVGSMAAPAVVSAGAALAPIVAESAPIVGGYATKFGLPLAASIPSMAIYNFAKNRQFAKNYVFDDVIDNLLEREGRDDFGVYTHSKYRRDDYKPSIASKYTPENNQPVLDLSLNPVKYFHNGKNPLKMPLKKILKDIRANGNNAAYNSANVVRVNPASWFFLTPTKFKGLLGHEGQHSVQKTLDQDFALATRGKEYYINNPYNFYTREVLKPFERYNEKWIGSPNELDSEIINWKIQNNIPLSIDFINMDDDLQKKFVDLTKKRFKLKEDEAFNILHGLSKLGYFQNGGNLGHITPYGQWQYPHQITTIPSNNITMQGVDYPVVGVSDTGDKKLMLPGLDYIYDGNYVTEYPVNKYQNGGQINALKQAAMNLKTNSMTNQEFADSLYTKPQQAINFYTTNRFPTVLNRAITNKSVKPLLTSGAPVFYNQVWDKDGNRDKIVGFWDYLHSAKTKEVSKPLTNTQMAALFGNIYQESQFENIKQKNGPADSMLQMEPDRQQQYNTWIKQNGYADGDKTKLLYISYLLQNPEKNDLMTPYDTFQKLTPEQQKSDDYKTARKLAQMKEYKNYTTKQAIQDLNSNNIDKTTKAILALFFKAGKPDQARRLKYSRGMVKMFNDRKKNEKR